MSGVTVSHKILIYLVHNINKKGLVSENVNWYAIFIGGDTEVYEITRNLKHSSGFQGKYIKN